MAEVHVIAGFEAREGKEDQLRALLESMLAPTHAEPDVRCMSSLSQIRADVSIFTKHGRVKQRWINTKQRYTSSDWNTVRRNW